MSQDGLNAFVGYWLPRLDAEMREVLASDDASVAAHYGMMHYHMGWTDERFEPHISPTGKRLRPIFCLLACAEVGGDPVNALPAAAAIEILHNFSLVHDDIEDGDEMRRHRPTVWKIWGVPQGINAGDAMFAHAFASVQRLTRRGVSAAITLDVLELFTQTCIKLTEGQHQDMSFEDRDSVTVDEYMQMIQGKTASLIGASVAIGAIIGGATKAQDQELQQFGRSIGLAFQIQDDILGIWGDPAITGKAAGNDILRRKKSLPLLYALNHPQIGSQLRALWTHSLSPDELPQIMDLLEQVDTRAFAEQQFLAQHATAIGSLNKALGARMEQSGLLGLANGLLNRRS